MPLFIPLTGALDQPHLYVKLNSSNNSEEFTKVHPASCQSQVATLGSRGCHNELQCCLPLVNPMPSFYRLLTTTLSEGIRTVARMGFSYLVCSA